MNIKINPYRGKEYKTKNMNLQLFGSEVTPTEITYKNVLLHPNRSGTSQLDIDIIPKGMTDNNKQDIIQVNSVPAAVPGFYEKIKQYTGTTNNNYTKGYFYKCNTPDGATPWANILMGPDTVADRIESADSVESREISMVKKTEISPDFIQVNDSHYVKIKNLSEYQPLNYYDLPTETTLNINRLFEQEYQITGNISHGSISVYHLITDKFGPNTMWDDESQGTDREPKIYVYIEPNEGYLPPETVTVTNTPSSYAVSYDQKYGLVALIGPPTGDIVITGECALGITEVVLDEFELPSNINDIIFVYDA